MNPRIQIRDKIVSLVKEMADFSDKNVQLYKMDRVDKTPSASIYLGRLNSEISTCGEESNYYDRDLTIMVDFHSDHGTDADSQTSEWLAELERLIYRAEKSDAFPVPIDDVMLSFAEFMPTATSNERRGDLVSAWRVEFAETVTTS